jgi:hypothetical protein
MAGLWTRRDPWWEDGQGARRVRTRHKVVSVAAFAAAIAACGLTAAAWLRELLPAIDGLGLG